MINRGNWLLVKKYLQYRITYDQVSNKTLRLEKTWLKHLLTWGDEKQIKDFPKIQPVFPEYVKNQLSKSGKPFSYEYQRKLISCAKRFLTWLTIHKGGYRQKINPIYLDTLKPSRGISDPYIHEFVTLEEIMAIASAPVFTLRDRRIRASAVFWFLSGIRIKAFATLPLKAVDLDNLTIKQWPSLGVETKNKKSATTFLLNIEPLFAVVKDWDQFIRKNLSEDSYWFAHFSPDTGLLDPNIHHIGKHRDQRARKDLKDWLLRIGLTYHSPHKFRHGHAVYSLNLAKDLGDLKAISQNMMHANLSTTDGIYGMFSNEEVKKKITSLGYETNLKTSKEEIINQFESALEQLINLK